MMKLKLNQNVIGLGKAGDVVEVKEPGGSALVCQGVGSVVSHDAPKTEEASRFVKKAKDNKGDE